MRRTRRRVVASLLSLGVIASLVVSAPIARAERRDDADRIDHAIAYLAAQQRPNGSIPAFSPIGSTADAVLAFVAAGVGEEQLTRCARVPPATRRPRKGRQRRDRREDRDRGRRRRWRSARVRRRRPRAVDRRLARPTRPVRHGVGLRRCTRGDGPRRCGKTVSDDAIQWLVDAQCADGGWQYSKPASANDDEHCPSTVRPTKDFFESDTNTTSYVMQAIEAAGGSTFTADPFAFFDAIRDAQRHGWGYTWGFQTTDANSTALVIQAYRRHRHACPGRRARRAAEAAGPHMRRLVVHVDGLAADRPGSGLDDRRDPRSPAAAAAAAAGAVVGSAAPVPACG